MTESSSVSDATSLDEAVARRRTVADTSGGKGNDGFSESMSCQVLKLQNLSEGIVLVVHHLLLVLCWLH